MAWHSLLPANLSVLETWIARIFILLGVLTIGPWAALIVYDVLLYIWRSLTYELPLIGGRARGKQRPRAPSLTARPDGHRRRFSVIQTANENTQTHGDDSSVRATGASRFGVSDNTKKRAANGGAVGKED